MTPKIIQAPQIALAPQGIRVYHDNDGNIEDEQFCPDALKIQRLAYSFHSLVGLRGIEPWDPSVLATESIPNVSSGTRHALVFVLSVWNPKAPQHYGLEPFDVHDALKIWDTPNRDAFATWARDPWWA